jgi:hypothetical protein
MYLNSDRISQPAGVTKLHAALFAAYRPGYLRPPIIKNYRRHGDHTRCLGGARNPDA